MIITIRCFWRRCTVGTEIISHVEIINFCLFVVVVVFVLFCFCPSKSMEPSVKRHTSYSYLEIISNYAEIIIMCF